MRFPVVIIALALTSSVWAAAPVESFFPIGDETVHEMKPFIVAEKRPGPQEQRNIIGVWRFSLPLLVFSASVYIDFQPDGRLRMVARTRKLFTTEWPMISEGRWERSGQNVYLTFTRSNCPHLVGRRRVMGIATLDNHTLKLDRKGKSLALHAIDRLPDECEVQLAKLP
ncbi:MAG: hypothetical protein HZA31_05055 [Opitutae bacterium]|nr:hypothetical protein [Opitutae bacterium]